MIYSGWYIGCGKDAYVEACSDTSQETATKVGETKPRPQPLEPGVMIISFIQELRDEVTIGRKVEK